MADEGAEPPQDAPTDAEEPPELEDGELMVLPENSLGLWNGRTFFLRSFSIWYRWRTWQYQQRYKEFTDEKPETGEINGLYFEQTMGRMNLWYQLQGKSEDCTKENISVDISCWEMEVTMTVDGKPGKRPGKKVDGICGEFFADIRRKYSWWDIFEDGESEFPGRWIFFSLAKVEHRPWAGVWHKFSMNIHKKTVFGWTPQTLNYKMHAAVKSEEEHLAYVWPGEIQEPDKAMSTGILPERLCSGLDDDIDETWDTISVLIHCDAETLEVATGMVPLEELFAADVTADSLEVYLRYENLGICSGKLLGLCIPELTTWEMTSVRRRLPKDTTIKAPAFYNQALRITLVKALHHRTTWGHAFADYQSPQWELPRERESWTDRVQRALVLSPAAPMSTATKTERALKLCHWVDCSEDGVTAKATVALHMDLAMGELFARYRVDPATFFALKVGESMLEVKVIADSEFRMIIGNLGGKCIPEKTSWNCSWEPTSPEDPREHMVLWIGLSKAPDSRDAWGEVFTRLEPWQVSEGVHKSLADNPPPSGKTKMSAPAEDGTATTAEEE